MMRENGLSISCVKCVCAKCNRKDECIYRPCNLEDVDMLYCKWVKTSCNVTTDRQNDE